MSEAFATTWCAAAVTAATPLALTGIGELVAERSGVIDIGIEGLMLSGCIAGFSVLALTGSPLLALTAAIVVGAALAALFAIATIVARADQIVSGMAINLLAIGVSGAAWQALQSHGHGELAADAGFSRLVVPGLADLPFVGAVCFRQYGLCYVTAFLAIAVAWMLRRTRAGLAITALGDAPAACAAAGFNVRRWRTLCVIFAGACAGAGGAYLSIMRTHSFAPLMTGGKGFVVLALVILGRWRIGGLVAGCLLFGLADGMQQTLQSRGYASVIPYQALQALPYVVALIALSAMRRGRAGPAVLGRAWEE